MNELELRWKVDNDASNAGLDMVYLYEDLEFADLGFRAADCDGDTTDTKSCFARLRVERGDTHKYTIAVQDTSSNRVTVSASTVVHAPSPPIVTGGGHVDMLQPTPQTFGWSHPDSCVLASEQSIVNCSSGGTPVHDHWFEVLRPRSDRFEELPPGTVTESAPLSVLGAPGEYFYDVRYCVLATAASQVDAGALTDAAARKICSASARVGYIVGPARWKEHRLGGMLRTGRRIYMNSASGDLDVTHTGDSGNVWAVTSPTLLGAGVIRWSVQQGNGWISPTTFRIPEAALTAGYHRLTLTSCHNLERCSNRENLSANVAGTFYPGPAGVYFFQGDVMAAIVHAPDAEGETIEWLTAPATGTGYFLYPAETQVTGSTVVGFVITNRVDVLHIEVDGSTSWEQGRDWREDFDELGSTAHPQLGPGRPLDVAYGPDVTPAAGIGIWQLGEYGTGIDHLDATGAMHFLYTPIRRRPDTTVSYRPLRPVKPFSVMNFFGEGGYSATNRSALGERVTEIGGKMWFAHGGGLFGNPNWNHSRVVSFDPDGVDLPHTDYDDRLCAYHVPTNDAEVVGITGTPDRIWIGEYRGAGSGESRRWAISSFPPTTDPGVCATAGNFPYDTLAYDAGIPTVPLPLPRCSLDANGQVSGGFCMTVIEPCPATTPGGACVESVQEWNYETQTFSDHPANTIGVAHLAIDPIDATIWFVDPHATVLGQLDPATGAIHTWPVPTPVDERDPVFGSYPWSLRVTADAVYFGEYRDNDVVRFDKDTFAYDEAHVPFANAQLRLHSIDIDEAANRLWFTLSNETHTPEDPTAGTIGYIDLTSWEEHLSDPAHPRIRGTTYAGLESINASGRYAGLHQGFRGIAVHPSTGRIALATAHRNQITELRPR